MTACRAAIRATSRGVRAGGVESWSLQPRVHRPHDAKARVRNEELGVRIALAVGDVEPYSPAACKPVSHTERPRRQAIDWRFLREWLDADDGLVTVEEPVDAAGEIELSTEVAIDADA